MLYFQKKKKEGKYGVGTNLMHPFLILSPLCFFSISVGGLSVWPGIKKGGGRKGRSLSQSRFPAWSIGKLMNRPFPPSDYTEREIFLRKCIWSSSSFCDGNVGIATFEGKYVFYPPIFNYVQIRFKKEKFFKRGRISIWGCIGGVTGVGNFSHSVTEGEEEERAVSIAAGRRLLL